MRPFDFEIARMISDQIALHSVQLPLYINTMSAKLFHDSFRFTTYISLIILLKYEFYCRLSLGVNKNIPALLFLAWQP